MLGKNHATLAAAGWLAAAVPVSEALNAPLTTSEFAVGAVVCAGAGVLPDIDHPDSRVSNSLGPVTGAASYVISALAGGHRQRTHTIWFPALTAALAHFATAAHPAAGPVIAGLLVGLAVSLVGPSLGVRVRTWHSLVASAAAGALVHTTVPAGPWLTAAVAAGCLLHLVGDALTPQGIPLMWPAPGRVRIPVFRTGGITERVVGVLLLGTVVYLSYEAFAPHVA